MGLSSPDRVIEDWCLKGRVLVVGPEFTPSEVPDPHDALVHCTNCRNQVCTPGNFCPCCGTRN